MMERNLLSNLIKLSKLSILSILVILCIPIAFANYTIEDFEDVSDWTYGDDFGNFDTSTTQVKAGTYSGRMNATNTVAGTGNIQKEWNGLDASSYDNYSFWIWIDENDFPYEFLGQCSWRDQSADGCTNSDVSITKTLQTDDGWSQYISSGISTWTFCNVSDLDRLLCEISTEDAPSVPFYIYIDQLELVRPPDSCTPPTSGDWTIINGDACTLNEADTITGNLNISDGSLEIQGSGTLTVSGGYVYIYSGNQLSLLSGGQING